MDYLANEPNHERRKHYCTLHRYTILTSIDNLVEQLMDVFDEDDPLDDEIVHNERIHRFINSFASPRGKRNFHRYVKRMDAKNRQTRDATEVGSLLLEELQGLLLQRGQPSSARSGEASTQAQPIPEQPQGSQSPSTTPQGSQLTPTGPQGNRQAPEQSMNNASSASTDAPNNDPATQPQLQPGLPQPPGGLPSPALVQ